MSPIQQMLLGVGAVATKTYVDDIFSTFLYEGVGSGYNDISVNNGINLSGEGGLVWVKNRDDSKGHVLADTVRGATKTLYSNTTAAEVTYNNRIKSFSSTGFTVGKDDEVDYSGRSYSSFTFRKAPGFFDVVTYTGTGSSRTVAHSLGSVPGFIIIKCTSHSDQWECFHDALGVTERIRLESSGEAFTDGGGAWDNTAPTSTHFTVNTNNGVNGNGRTYVAYLFAGGESTAADAKSVEFTKANSSYLSIADNNDFDLGTGDFTIECWVKVGNVSATSGTIFMIGNEANTSSLGINIDNSQSVAAYVDQGAQGMIFPDGTLAKGQWRHLALTKSSNVVRMFVDGTSSGSSYTQTNSIGGGSNGNLTIGASDENGTKRSFFDGEISNFRIIKGTALYTSSFKPTYEPLTNVTNTKLLCCNDSSTTGSSVTPGTITSSGSPTASSNSPFDDPAGFVFGDSGTENVIKCGSYEGSGSAGLEVKVGFEPQWLLVKCAENSEAWVLFDSMRGIVSGGNDLFLEPNSSGGENTFQDWIELTATGFKIITANYQINQNNKTYIFTCIRRSDGYVGKPPELGTDVFAMDTGSNSSTIPTFDSGFPVDFAFQKLYAGSEDWYLSSRLIQGKYLFTNTSEEESSSGNMVFDSNAGWALDSNSTYQSWMWKRHAGMDVVTYSGTGSARQIPHNLSKIPDMLWIKCRDDDKSWIVGHKGLNGGVNSEQYHLYLNLSNSEIDDDIFNDTAHTSTHFNVKTSQNVNGSNKEYIAMLFASVEGISSVGSFTGPDPEATITIDCGFQPRFVMIKCASHARDWVVFDTVRGIAAGADKKLALNTTAAQVTTEDMIDLTSSGFSLPHGSYLDTNWPSREFIYYAHS